MIELRLATITDSKFLFNCRNDDATRKNSHNSQKINYDTHVKWLTNTIKQKTRKLYVVEIEGNPVATVRADFIFEKEERIVELSWAVAPKERGKGVCKLMIKKVMESIGEEKKFYAEIKATNLISIKVAEYLGMILKKKSNGVLFYFKN